MGRLSVDKTNETVLVPIGPRLVPIQISLITNKFRLLNCTSKIYCMCINFCSHLSNVKCATTSSEGEYIYFRLNLYNPGNSTIGRAHGSNFSHPDRSFTKELSLGRNQNMMGQFDEIVSTIRPGLFFYPFELRNVMAKKTWKLVHEISEKRKKI